MSASWPSSTAITGHSASRTMRSISSSACAELVPRPTSATSGCSLDVSAPTSTTSVEPAMTVWPSAVTSVVTQRDAVLALVRDQDAQLVTGLSGLPSRARVQAWRGFRARRGSGQSPATTSMTANRAFSLSTHAFSGFSWLTPTGSDCRTRARLVLRVCQRPPATQPASPHSQRRASLWAWAPAPGVLRRSETASFASRTTHCCSASLGA